MTRGEVENEVEADPIGLTEALLGEVLCRGGEHHADSREFLFQRLLHVVVICAATDARVRYTNGFFEHLDCQEGQNEGLLRCQGAPIGKYEALLHSELVD